MIEKLRDTIPIRSQVKEKPKYQDYRDELQSDFNYRCGYCDDSDEFIDRILFHIDHFAPKKKFPNLITSYNNLVYACRYCNMSKFDYWVGKDHSIPNDGEEGIVDPCSMEYDLHLARSSNGAIVAKTKLGLFIIKRLKLDLLRHVNQWESRRLRKNRDTIGDLINKLEDSGKADQELLDLYRSYYKITNAIENLERN